MSGYSKIIWYLKRTVFDIKNIIFTPSKNLASSSKSMYENLSANNYEIREYNRDIVALYDGVPVFTNFWNHRVRVGEDFIKVFNELQPKSILEVGCGEGLTLFSILSLNKNFFQKGVSWTGFDFSIIRALKAFHLFDNHPNTKGGNIHIYNGDATNIHHKSKSFDVTISNCVLEQIKYKKHEALKEMSRVSKYMVLREPLYKEQSFRGKLHFRYNDYIKLTLKNIEKYGEIMSIEVNRLSDPTYRYVTIIIKNN